MAKKSRKRLAKDQSGCIRSLIHNIFDFRQGRSSQKLLQDKKHESKRIAAAAYPAIKLESLSESCAICKESIEAIQTKTSTADGGKTSVKELMAEEMIGEKDKKKHGNDAIRDAKHIAAGDGAPVQKNRRRTRSMTSLHLRADDFTAVEGSIAEKPNHRRHKSLSSIYLNVMVEELCSQINQNDGEIATEVIKDPSVKEDKLWEASRVLISQFTDGKSVTEDGKIQASKELVDALRIIDSNKEAFLKLLQDPNSQLVKNIQSMQDVRVEEGKFKVVTGSNLLDQGTSTGKQQNFFWRKFKGLERNQSKKNDASEDLNRIVVLQPGPGVSRNSELASFCGSLPESPLSVGKKDQVSRVSSTFSFAEFKRRLKHVMGKEQHGAAQIGMSHQLSDERPNLTNREKRDGAETVAMASPSRDHFFIERIPKSSAGKKADKKGKLKVGSVHLENDADICPEQRVSNMYVEAKKHLAEIIGTNMVDADSPRRQAPRSLGKLMSFSGYISPTLCSPRLEREIQFSPREVCQADDKICQVKQESNASLQVPVKQESGIKPCIAAHIPICEAEVPPVAPISDGPPCESCVDKPNHGPEVPTSEVDADIARSPDAEGQAAENNQMERSFKPDSLQSIRTSEHVDHPPNSICSEDNWHSARLGQDSCTESESSSSQTASALSGSVTDKFEGRELMSDATSKPSPVSVLEPLFTEDDVSPPGIKSLSAVQPRQIRFEEEILAPSERYPCHRTCIDYEKHTFDFVKAVVQMSGLTWDELHRRTLFSAHHIDPLLLDEVDFLPDLLPCDFNLLFDLINEVVIEISWSNFGCMIRFLKPLVHPTSKDKDVFTEIWGGVSWYLKLEGSPRTLDQIVSKDLAKSGLWMNLRSETETIGIQLQEAILEELVEDTILSCVSLV